MARRSEDKGLELGALIQYAADQIREARSSAEDDAVMQFKGCELELAVTVSKKAKGGIKFYVIDAGAEIGAQQTSRIKLSFGTIDQSPVVFLAGGDDTVGEAAPPRKAS